MDASIKDVFQKVGNTKTLSQKIERTIEDAIRQRKLAVGSKLPTEREMCESFGVSRTALREALRRLSARGLIEIKKGSGMYVSDINIEDAISSLSLYYDLSFDANLIAQIIEVRRVYEPQNAKLAALNRSEKYLQKLDANITDFINCNPDNTQLEADIDNRFHLLIAQATQNPIIQISMEPVYYLIPRMRDLIYANVDGEKENTLDFHRRIYKAIKDQDSDAAYEQMENHLKRNEQIYHNYLSK